MPALAQCGNCLTWRVLVGQNPHRSRHHHGIDLFCPQGSAGVAQAGLHIFMCQPWIVAQKLCLRLALSQQIDDELHRKASPPHDWLSYQDIRIDFDSLLPIQRSLLHSLFITEIECNISGLDTQESSTGSAVLRLRGKWGSVIGRELNRARGSSNGGWGEAPDPRRRGRWPARPGWWL